ncbi:FUSC family protein [Vibrio sp. 14N.309.X.WAT.E.F5]|uniref:FUSC family protein n=1 Tax=Vibrio sp. 14N.309.X.WAT.E.F5 TaxID=2998321 RepID=UPI0025B2091C|nr:FUSC family protein [Vibrio sp. 14N.309.X.WAT.E.F5]MDN2665292.1 FUSC family protein [Vibrio sp. 14N.309.X.WAT.E.F5]
MTFSPAILRKIWYSPSINLGLRATSAIVLFLGLGVLSNHLNIAMTALMTMPAALISGLDAAGPRRWTRFAITATAWGITLAVSYVLLNSGLPLWLTYGAMGALLASTAVNGPFWARLGMSSLLIAVVTLSLHNSNSALSLYPMLVLGPLTFALFSWLWFALWKHYALRVCLSAIYETLADYIQYRQTFLLGGENEAPKRRIKYQLIELFQQALQSESFRSKHEDADSLRQALFLALDTFEVILSSHTSNPDLLSQFQSSKQKRDLLLVWSQHCQQRLRHKAKQLLHNTNEEMEHLSSLEQEANDLIEAVKLEDQPRFRYWAYAVKHISRRIELNEPAYERSFEVQPFELSFRLPSRGNPIWRHVTRVGLMFALGAGIAEYFELIRPDWVLISMLMVIQPSFLATRSKTWQRCLGTALGVLFATSLIHIGVPTTAMYTLMVILLPVAMLNIMRNYSLAIGCITALLILIYQTMAHQGLDFAAPRLIDNIVGGTIVLLGYGLLWPQWRGKEINNQALTALNSSKSLFVYCYEQLQVDTEQRDHMALTKQRAAMLTAESDLELIYNEMQQEPRHTRTDPHYYEDMLSHYRLLSHYLCLLIPLIRTGTQYQGTQQVERLIHDAMNALVNTIRDNHVHELPALTNNADHLSSTTGQRSVEEIIWLALMTVKQMHDLVRCNLES